MLSADNECIWVTSQGATKQEFSFLSQEGANTKLVLGAHTYFKNSLASAIAIYSPLFQYYYSHYSRITKNFLIDFMYMDNIKNCKLNYWITSIQRKWLHQLYFGKKKTLYFKLLESSYMFQNIFCKGAESWELPGHIFSRLQEVVCNFYNRRKKEDKAKKIFFTKKSFYFTTM